MPITINKIRYSPKAAAKILFIFQPLPFFSRILLYNEEVEMSTRYVLVVDIFENPAMSVAMTRFLEGLKLDALHRMSDRIPIPAI